MPLRPRRLLLAMGSLAMVVSTAMVFPNAQTERPSRLAFLRDGEVWMSERDGQRATQLTRTRGKVEDFSIEPAGDYLAYSRTVKYVDDSGVLEPGEKPGKRGVQSIVIVSLGSGRTIATLEPAADEWIHIDKWLPRGRLLGHSSSGFDVTDVFEFDVATRQRRDLGLEIGGRLIEGDAVRDGSLTTYVDDIGLGPTYQERLHLVDRGTDTVRASKRSIGAPRIAHGKQAVAFVEVTNGSKPVHDRVWVVSLSSGDLRLVFEDTVRPKTWGVAGLSWSLDDRYLAINYGGVATIVDTRSSGGRPAQIRGTDVCWIGAGEMILASQMGIDLYDVASGARRTLVPNASSPRCMPGT